MESFLYNDEFKQSKNKNGKEMITSQIIIKMINSDIQRPVYTATNEDKYVSSAVLSVIGDMIGYGNGEWKYSKFRTITWDSTLEMLFEFISEGGINNINMNNWKATYCSLTLISLLSTYSHINKNDELVPYIVRSVFVTNIEKYKKLNNFINVDDRYKTKFSQKNENIVKYIESFTKHKINDNYIYPTEFDENSYDNKACTYGIAIGLALNGKKNRNMLIEHALYIATTTHTSPIGYLGCLTVALFIAFAIENINIETWAFQLIDILSNNKFIVNFINTQSKINNNNENVLIHYDIYLKYWTEYVDLRFRDKKPIEMKSMKNVMFRSSFYSKHFGIDKHLSQEGKKYLKSVIGSTGYSATIVAYDCLLDSKNNWTTAVTYGILNIGDSSTLGSIIGGIYGTMYGFDNVPAQNLIYCPLKDNFISQSFFVYKKYFKKENSIDSYMSSESDESK